MIKAQILAGGRGKGTFDSGFKGKQENILLSVYEKWRRPHNHFFRFI